MPKTSLAHAQDAGTSFCSLHSKPIWRLDCPAGTAGPMLKQAVLCGLLVFLSPAAGAAVPRLLVFGDALADDGNGTNPLAQAAVKTSEVG